MTYMFIHALVRFARNGAQNAKAQEAHALVAGEIRRYQPSGLIKTIWTH